MLCWICGLPILFLRRIFHRANVYIFMKSNFHFTDHTFDIKHEKPILIPRSLRFSFFFLFFLKFCLKFHDLFWINFCIRCETSVEIFNTFIYLFLVMLGLCHCAWTCSSCSEWRGCYSLQWCVGYWAHGLSNWDSGSRVQAQQSGCPGLVAWQHVESSWARDWAHVPCIERQLTVPPGMSSQGLCLCPWVFSYSSTISWKVCLFFI